VGVEDVRHVPGSVMNVLSRNEPWKTILPKVAILCDAEDPLARKIKGSQPAALWGGSLGILAVIYHFEPALIWHEMLHLLGAHDCYDPDSPDEGVLPSCGNANCLMQYAPSLDRVGDPPFICEAAVRDVHEYLRILAIQ
jgi:hypothetical protein